MKKSLLLISAFSLLISCKSTEQKLYTSTTKNHKHLSKWAVVNGEWSAQDTLLEGTKNQYWAIVNLHKKLPDNYSITFSSQVKDGTYLFEIMLDIKDQAFLGILYNTLDKKIQIEDRKLYSAEEVEKENAYIRTKNHIGQLPKYELKPSTKWVDWKIEKRNNQLYIWINQEEYVHYQNNHNLLQTKGQLGFAINGNAKIKNIVITPLKQADLLSPIEFKEKPKVLPFFLFSE
ncbi:hypothetical protein [Myroides marinus]|uniref:hypothetical protein n=1 Tax=Myroides marinus TaxID=703342 RepID=UPI002575E428|nr:hypothetical protein [Myroides marinus]MDM1354843.1 hypothetical protein [Myroides marinus]